jgi:hypothetical protein
MLTFPDPYSSCGVEMDPDPKVVVGTVLEKTGREEDVVCVVDRVVVVTVGRIVVVIRLSRVEGQYVNRVGIR